MKSNEKDGFLFVCFFVQKLKPVYLRNIFKVQNILVLEDFFRSTKINYVKMVH